MILKVVHQVVLVLTIQPPLFVSGFRRTAVGFRLFSAEMVDALCLSTLRFCLIISWGLIPRPLGRKYLITIPIPRCLRRGSLLTVVLVLCAGCSMAYQVDKASRASFLAGGGYSPPKVLPHNGGAVTLTFSWETNPKNLDNSPSNFKNSITNPSRLSVCNAHLSSP